MSRRSKQTKQLPCTKLSISNANSRKWIHLFCGPLAAADFFTLFAFNSFQCIFAFTEKRFIEEISNYFKSANLFVIMMSFIGVYFYKNSLCCTELHSNNETEDVVNAQQFIASPIERRKCVACVCAPHRTHRTEQQLGNRTRKYTSYRGSSSLASNFVLTNSFGSWHSQQCDCLFSACICFRFSLPSCTTYRTVLTAKHSEFQLTHHFRLQQLCTTVETILRCGFPNSLEKIGRNALLIN